MNGLDGLNQPWKIVIAYEQFDEDGDKVHKGTYEELWAGPKKYTVRYTADDLNQTDYATAQGLFRQGDQKWPNRAQAQIPNEVMNPFFYATTLQGASVHDVLEKFGDHTLSCSVIERGGVSNPTRYCFEPGGLQLRYSRGAGWYQTSYNGLTLFLGRTVGQVVDVYDGGKLYLKLRVRRLEAAPDAIEADFVPPPDAKNLSGQVLEGVNPVPLEQLPPDWPDSLKQDRFSVTVQILIGTDGHVKSAHATSGPQKALKSAEATARRWRFQPYMVLDEPVEVNTKIILSNN